VNGASSTLAPQHASEAKKPTNRAARAIVIEAASIVRPGSTSNIALPDSDQEYRRATELATWSRGTPVADRRACRRE